MLQVSNIEPNDMQHPTRNQRTSSTLNDSITYSTVGASRKEKPNISSKDREQEFKIIYFNILDNMNNEMVFRFTQNHKILQYIHACVQT